MGAKHSMPFFNLLNKSLQYAHAKTQNNETDISIITSHLMTDVQAASKISCTSNVPKLPSVNSTRVTPEHSKKLSQTHSLLTYKIPVIIKTILFHTILG
jgi:hypothetical protein